jgi:hypothetical protein
MATHKVVKHDEWLAARKKHLAKEKEFTRLRSLSWRSAWPTSEWLETDGVAPHSGSSEGAETAKGVAEVTAANPSSSIVAGGRNHRNRLASPSR